MACMTSSDPIQVPAFVTASTLALRLASPLFRKAMTAQAAADPNDPALNAWWVMRQTAEKWMHARSIHLAERDLKDFGKAVRVAHELAHDCEPGDIPDIEECGCPTADMLRELCVFLAETEEAEHAAPATR